MSFPLVNPTAQFFDSSGSPLANGTIEFRDPSDDTYIDTFPTADDADAGTNANANPLTLNSRGEPSSGIYLQDGVKYKITLRQEWPDPDTPGTIIWTQDDVLCPIGLPYLQTAAESAAGVTPTNLEYPPGDVRRYGASSGGTAATNTTAFQNAALSTHDIIVPDGSYNINDAVTLNSNQGVILNSSVTITQTATDKQIFLATQKNNIHIQGNGATLVGEGTWSAAWTGMGGHLDRALQFLDCTHVFVSNLVIKDCGNAGIYIESGDYYHLDNITVIGTHNLSTVISAEGNFQCGIFIRHDQVTYSSVNNLTCTGFDISDTAQGIVVESGGTFSDDTISMYFDGVVHDIPGQHGMYIQSGGTTVNLTAENCNLAAYKLQSGGANHDIKGHIFNVNAKNCGSQAIEIATTGTGWISGIDGRVVCHDCQRGLSIADKVRDADITVQAEDVSQHGIVIQGDELHNMNLKLIARNCGRYGFISTATNSDGINLINPIIREANDSASTYDGIYVNSATCTMDIFNPTVTDANTNMVNGIFINAGTVGVYGKVTATGASSYGARFNVAADHWPSDEKVTLGGTTAAFLNGSNFVKKSVTTLANDATPSVFGGGLFKTGGTTTITDFDDGAVGDTITILAAHSVTITDGAPIILAGGANFAMVASDTLTLTMFNDQVWQEVSRSVN